MKIKKILLLIMFLGISIFTCSLKVKAGIFNGCEYRVNSREETNYLKYGVMHYREIALTNKEGSSSLDLQQVNVLEVPVTTGVKVTTWAYTPNNTWTRSTVKDMIADYELNNPSWKVVAAVNGDFFDVLKEGRYGSMPYQTRGPVVCEGEYYKTRFHNATSTTIGFKNDGSVNSLVGYKKISRTETMKLSIYDNEDNIIKTFDVAKLNEAPAEGGASLYFGKYKDLAYEVSTAPIVGTGWVVEDAIKALPTNDDDFYGKGIITKQITNESFTLENGSFVIDSKNPDLDAALSVGTKIRVQFEFVGDFAGCTSIAGAESTVVYNGKLVNKGDGARHPRTAIGIKSDGKIVMMVVDGRQESKGMYGATHTEIASIMQSLGCVDVYNLDGGGSSTLVINEKDEWVVKNSPSDGGERKDANCMLIVVQEPMLEIEPVEVLNNKVTLSVNILNANNHDIKDLFIKCNGVDNLVVDGKVTISKLSALTEYKCSIGYKSSQNLMYQTYLNYNVVTDTTPYSFNGVKVDENNEAYTFTVDYKDRGKVTNLPSSTLEVNGKTYTFTDGVVVVPKAEVGEVIKTVNISYTKLALADNGEITTKVITVINPHSKMLQIADIIANEYNKNIGSIFR